MSPSFDSSRTPDATLPHSITEFAAMRQDAQQLMDWGRQALLAGDDARALYLLHRATTLCPNDRQIRSDLGWARLRNGDLIGAQRDFDAILAHAPQHPSALRGLASCRRAIGDAVGAAHALQLALATQPASLALLLELTEACTASGDAAAAGRYLQQAAQLAPEQPALWLAQARFLRQHGHAAEALPWIDRYGRQFPHDAAARIEKARCLRVSGRCAEAMRWLERLEARQPGIAENSEEYGHCLTEPAQAPMRIAHWTRAIRLWVERGDFAAARKLSERLLLAHPDNAAAWDALARIELAQQHWDAVEVAWRNALDRDPTFLDAAAGLAHLYEDSNRPEQAVLVAQTGLAQAGPGTTRSGTIELHLALCKAARRTKRIADGLAHLANAEALASTDSQREFVAFQRAHLLDLAGDADAAFAAFTRGNALALAGWQAAHPGPNRYLQGVQDLLTRACTGWLHTLGSIAAQPSIPEPAFLVGFPRSGTSLLNHVLDGHPAIQTMEEKPPAQAMLAAVRAMPGGYPRALAELDGIDASFLREAYFRSAQEHGGGDLSKLLLDKFPLHINIAVLLHRVFPGARFVFALRHPCDVVLSCFMQQFRLNPAMANFCSVQGTVDLYCRTMDLWEIVCAQLPLRVHTIRYEDVVADFDGQVQALCDFLGVARDDDLRHFAERARTRGRIDTPSYAQVSRPLYRDAVQRWQRYRIHLEPWLPTLQPYIERFGYT